MQGDRLAAFCQGLTDCTGLDQSDWTEAPPWLCAKSRLLSSSEGGHLQQEQKELRLFFGEELGPRGLFQVMSSFSWK